MFGNKCFVPLFNSSFNIILGWGGDDMLVFCGLTPLREVCVLLMNPWIRCWVSDENVCWPIHGGGGGSLACPCCILLHTGLSLIRITTPGSMISHASIGHSANLSVIKWWWHDVKAPLFFSEKMKVSRNCIMSAKVFDIEFVLGNPICVRVFQGWEILCNSQRLKYKFYIKNYRRFRNKFELNLKIRFL